MRITASGVKSGKGSDTASGETPVCSGRPMSFMVKTLAGGAKLRCFSGSKASLARGGMVLSAGGAVQLDVVAEGIKTSADAMVVWYWCLAQGKLGGVWILGVPVLNERDW